MKLLWTPFLDRMPVSVYLKAVGALTADPCRVMQ
jgi:hypothetical protein